MTAEVLSFLAGDPDRIALFEAAEAAIRALGESTMQVSKTQISWGNPKKFAFFSLPLRVGSLWPKGCVILSFGLEHRVDHPRITQFSNPYPNRWTHHVVLNHPGQVSGEVCEWLAMAYHFSKTKAPVRQAKRD